MEKIEIGISKHNDIEYLENEIRESIRLALEMADGRHLVYRVSLTGRGTLHGLVNQHEYTEALRTVLNENWLSLRPFAYCDRVTVATRKEINRDDYTERDDFHGDLLRFFDQARSNSEIIKDLRKHLEQLYEHPRLRKYLSNHLPQHGELVSLLDEAESICLDLLVSEDSDQN